MGTGGSQKKRRVVRVMRKGSHLTEENKAKLRKPRTEEQKRNCSLAKMGNQYRKGCKNSAEANYKNSLAHKGKKTWNCEGYMGKCIRDVPQTPKRVVSEESRRKNSESHKGKKHSEETKRKIGLASLGRKGVGRKSKLSEEEIKIRRENFKGANNPFYGKGHTEESNQKNREAHLGRKMSEEARMKMSETHRKNKIWVGRSHSSESKKKQSLVKMGSKNPVWKNGASFYPYSLEWRRTLKEKIRQRDNNVCQLCLYDIAVLGIGWATHHIDYDKDNCDEENLILLCKRCHGRTNHTKRELWTSLFTTIIENVAFTP